MPPLLITWTFPLNNYFVFLQLVRLFCLLSGCCWPIFAKLYGEGWRPASEGGVMSATKITFGRVAGYKRLQTRARAPPGPGPSLYTPRSCARVSHFAARCSGQDPCPLTGGGQESGGHMKIMIKSGWSSWPPDKLPSWFPPIQVSESAEWLRLLFPRSRGTRAMRWIASHRSEEWRVTTR